MLEKSIIYPKVVVYHNLLENVDEIVEILKNLKSLRRPEIFNKFF